MKKIIDSGAARVAIREKKLNEFELAGAIRDHFDSQPLKRELNDMVLESTVLATMMKGFDSVWNGNRGKVAVVNAYRDVGALQKAAQEGRVSALHCGDFIRIFGEITEVKENKVEIHPDLKAAKEAFQIGGDEFWKKESSVDKHLPMVGQKADPGTRVRLGTKQRLPDISNSMRERIEKFGQVRSGPRKVAFRNLEPRSPAESGQIGAGMVVWAPQDLDILYRIEVAFGLRVGATISGTTADTLYFLSVFGKVGMDPIFYLLPFATIVAPGHHSLIEAALPLALAGHIGYRIGSYQTLMPIRESSSPAARGIRRTLKNFEDDPRNRLMLVWFLQREIPGGYWEATMEERPLFRSMAQADADLMRQFRTMSQPYMTELDLERWVRNAATGRPRAPIN